MKMLGQDVLTQEEFDTHMDKQFNPLKSAVEEQVSSTRTLKIVAFSALAVSAVNLLILILRGFM